MRITEKKCAFGIIYFRNPKKVKEAKIMVLKAGLIRTNEV